MTGSAEVATGSLALVSKESRLESCSNTSGTPTDCVTTGAAGSVTTGRGKGAAVGRLGWPVNSEAMSLRMLGIRPVCDATASESWPKRSDVGFVGIAGEGREMAGIKSSGMPNEAIGTKVGVAIVSPGSMFQVQTAGLPTEFLGESSSLQARKPGAVR